MWAMKTKRTVSRGGRVVSVEAQRDGGVLGDKVEEVPKGLIM